ncbi:tetratricopeptide repeat protein [Actomonas aquatica]|uniref:protein O-GlcNAc transferase n=1 Tax=Actomonas aquatica TaxID=2866162 RepID=A0ABZ1CCJ1_9BACT|nr:tetratricopeptide repeat protein [Opitutus sp. WL0086]WRQ89301.1 tetratricopeptide repeat protein [Opitutus sp. WL0086]
MNPNQLLQRAFTAHRAGQLAAAARDYAQLRRIAATSFDVWHLSGTLELQRDNPRLAADFLTRARQLNPRDAQCAFRHGLALQALGQLPAAIEAYRHTVSLDPAHADAHDRLGALALATTGHADAVPHFRAATQAKPDWPQPWCNLGITLTYTGDFDAARHALDRALALDPALAKAHTARGLLLQQTYDLPAAAEAFGAALARNPQDLEARSGRLLTLHYLDDVSAEQLAAEHRAYGDQLAPLEDRITAALQPAPFATPPTRLRIGFVSQDFRRHSVAWFMLPLLQHLDRDQFEVCLFHDHAIEDDISQQLRGLADHWENLHGQPDVTVVARLRAARLDLAIDLAGHTGINRLGVFAQRVAPVQISYLGYPNTTGLRAMDYRLVDAHTDPAPPAVDARASETLLRFADTLWAYAPPPASPAVSPPPVTTAPDRTPTFGSFNALTKVSDATVALWARLLDQVPGSRLVLKSAGLEQLDLARQVRARFAAHGINVERLRLLGRTPDSTSHLDLYREIDIALDPLPYHGTTTTCEALWMGRPVVTLAGDRHANRVGVSLLHALGHPEWIATDESDYLRIATDLVRDRAALASTSVQLRGELQASALMDHRSQAAKFGQALQTCWRTTHQLPAPPGTTQAA